MIVLKFGGTSLGTPERMKGVAALVNQIQEQKIVVLSAVSGTTNALVALSDALRKGASEQAQSALQALRKHYDQYIDDLFADQGMRDQASAVIDKYFHELRRLTSQPFSEQIQKVIVVQGELISTNLFSLLLQSLDSPGHLLPAIDFMYLNEAGEPDIPVIKTRLQPLLKKSEGATYVTQGFICRNADGGTDNLKRGGSDYTATLIGAAMSANEVQIWTDIDGMHNNDPRVVDNTHPIHRLSFDEAGELAYFGAKILHPNCIIPAQLHNVPVRIKNTMSPESEGTLITSQRDPKGAKAIAAKGNITAIKVKSSRMINAYGFLRKIFEVFEKYKTSIDMITTSEIAVSLTVDDDTMLTQIVEEIKPFGTVEVDKDQAIICVVGDFISESQGVGTVIFKALEDVRLRMISFGGSKNNISILIDGSSKEEALKRLNDHLFASVPLD
ncbi:MAG: aspartate kinase [Bacteroidota bacterium]